MIKTGAQRQAEYRARHPERAYRWDREHPEKRREIIKRWNKKNPEKVRAKNKVEKMVFEGKMQKPETCSECGSGGMIHGHHKDYSKPLEVEWLCQKCHMRRHKRIVRPKELGIGVVENNDKKRS